MVSFQILSVGTVSSHRGPEVRVAGRTADGRSVAVAVGSQTPFFYLRLDHGFLHADGTANGELIRAMCVELNAYLNEGGKLKKAAEFTRSSFLVDGTWNHVLGNVAVHEVFDYYGYSTRKRLYAKLRFASTEAHMQARFAMQSPVGGSKSRPPFSKALLVRIFGKNREPDIQKCFTSTKGVRRGGMELTLAEANISFEHQMLETMDLKPGGWATVDLSVASYSEGANASLSYSASGVNATECMKPAQVARAAPVRVLAWDIESFCEPIGNTGAMNFYDADHEKAKLLCISAVTFEYGVEGSTKSVVFSLGEKSPRETVAATDGSPLDILWFDCEHELIKAFLRHIVENDTDVLTGWNTLGEHGFDWPFLIGRCRRLGLLADFNRIGRWGVPKIDETEKAWQLVQVPGRVVHDSLIWMQRNRNLREYKLQFVCENLDPPIQGKDDVKYSDIAGLFLTHEGRVKLSVYCELDSRLVADIIRHKTIDLIGKTLAIGALTGVPVEDVIYRGSMHTLRLAMLAESHRNGYLLSCPQFNKKSDASEVHLSGDDETSATRFQGGKVLAPAVGFYREPVVCLDFASLYPTIMMEKNCCASTKTTRAYAKSQDLEYLQPPAPGLSGVWELDGVSVARCDQLTDWKCDFSLYGGGSATATFTDELCDTLKFVDGRTGKMGDDDYQITFDGGEVWRRRDADVLVFVAPAVRKGIIPLLEEKLKASRTKAKKDMKAAKAAGDWAAVAYYDNLQSSIKIVMNALYGLLGSERGGVLPDSSPIASCITARGRQLITTVKRTVESRFWVLPSGELGGSGGEPVPEDGQMLRVVYGDTVRGAAPP